MLAAGSNAAWAIVLHPTTATVTDRPGDAVVMRLSDNGTAVAIAPNFILTTAHQGLNANFIVSTAGSFKWAEIHAHPTADLRVLRITDAAGNPANLTDYVRLFDADTDGDQTHPTELGRDIVLGSHGRGRGATLFSGGAYGYAWDSNAIQRWGTNRIDSEQDGVAAVGRVSNTLVDDFDNLNRASATPAEAAVALYDSGSGWFTKVGSDWTLVGLSAYATHSGQSWYRDPAEDPVIDSGDNNWAIRVSDYSAFIYSTFVDLFLHGDMDGNGVVDNFDIQPFEQALANPGDYLTAHPTLTNYELRGDIDGDGDFDNFDIQPFEQLLTGNAAAGAAGAAVPEPATAVLAGLGAIGLLLARRYRRK